MATCTETISLVVIESFSGSGSGEFFGQGYILCTTARELFPLGEKVSLELPQNSRDGGFEEQCLKVMTLSFPGRSLCTEVLLKTTIDFLLTLGQACGHLNGKKRGSPEYISGVEKNDAEYMDSL